VTRRTKELLLSQPEEKKPQIAKASLQKGGGKGGLTRALNLRRRTKPHTVAAAAQLVEKEDPQTAHNTANQEI
jgi:hypothetical protein